MASQKTEKAKKKCPVKFSAQHKSKYPFLRKSDEGENSAWCTVCRCNIGIGHGGKHDIKLHVKTAKHARYTKQTVAVDKTPKITALFSSPVETNTLKAEVSSVYRC
ncbi:hypothetical protein ACOMHN_054675 [Nucella lapillus]